MKKVWKNKAWGGGIPRLGFTLIELLAVIVILAIIALIATPIVLDIIEDSKTSSVKISADNYKKAVEFYIANSQLNNETIEDGIYYVNELDIKVDNQPENGWYKIENNQVSDYKLLFENYIVESYDEDKIDITFSKIKDVDITEKREMNLVNLDKSENLKIDFISLSYDKNIKLNFYINKETYNEYENIKLNIINDYYDAYDTKSTKLKNIILDKAIKKGNYYVFEYNVDSTIMYLFGNFKISIEGVKDSINVTSQEYNYKLIDYFKEILYSEDITEKNRNILISLINYGACAQDTWPFYLSETDKTNIISLLKESDRNMTNLTSKAESLLNNDTLKLDTSIPNNYDSYLEDKFYKVGVTGITKFPLGFYFKLGNSNSTVATSQNITLEEFKKYGIIVFEENVFNEVMKTSDDYNNLNYYTKRAVILEASEENYDNLEMGFSYFEYNFDLQNPNKVIYYKLFYKSEDGNLNYSKLYIKSLGRYLKSANNNICKSMLNFIAEVNEI